MTVEFLSAAELAIGRGAVGKLYADKDKPAQVYAGTGAGFSPLGGSAMAKPAGFDWDFAKYPVTVFRVANGYDSDFVPEAHIDPACYAGPRYYVDFTSGNDANSGLTLALAVKSLHKAVQLANASGQPGARISVYSPSASSPVAFPRANGWTNNSTILPAVSLLIDVLGPGRVITGPFDALGWGAADGTYTNAYKVARGGVARVFDLTAIDTFGNYRELTPAANATAVNTTPGTWAQVSGDLYVRRHDGAAVTNTNTRVFLTADNMVVDTAAGNVFIGPGFDMEGGTGGAVKIAGASGNATDRKVVAVGCTAKYAGSAAAMMDGWRIVDFRGLVGLVGCEGSANAKDGINAHYTLDSARRTFVFTSGCRGLDNGRFTSQSNNGLTLHGTCVGIDIGGLYRLNRGGNFRNINETQHWAVGTHLSEDQGDTGLGGSMQPTNIQADNTAVMWLDYTKAGGASTAIRAADTARIYKRGHVSYSGAEVAASGAVIAEVK